MTGDKKKRFLSPDDLLAAAADVKEVAMAAGVRVALVGGFALQFRGSDRLTDNIDVIESEPLPGVPRGSPLPFGGIQTETKSGVPVNYILRGDEYTALYEEALNHAEAVRGVPMRVARIEHLAAMKMAAGRAKDWADLEWIVSSSKVPKLRAQRDVIRRHLGPYAAREFDQLVAFVRAGLKGYSS